MDEIDRFLAKQAAKKALTSGSFKSATAEAPSPEPVTRPVTDFERFMAKTDGQGPRYENATSILFVTDVNVPFNNMLRWMAKFFCAWLIVSAFIGAIFGGFWLVLLLILGAAAAGLR
ncbi:MAG TPA: hypothetical protein VF614_06420 [Chthoniobacteraceae bacterium]|jgi:hypothetical protein